MTHVANYNKLMSHFFRYLLRGKAFQKNIRGLLSIGSEDSRGSDARGIKSWEIKSCDSTTPDSVSIAI